MLKKVKYVLLFLCLYSLTPINYCSKDLKPYRNELLALTKQYCKPGQYYNPAHKFLHFRKMKDHIIGYCSPTLVGYSITIDPTYWNRTSEDDRFQLIAHEISHCILGKDHVEDMHNYMYYSIYPLTKEVVTKQFIENLRSTCGR